MLKSISLILCFSILFTGTTLGQSLSASPQPPVKPDLKSVLDAETKRIEAESGAIDAKSMDRESRRAGARKMTPKQKTWVVLGVVGMAALIFLLIKYYRECLRYVNDCNPTDEGCYCAEYAPRK